MGEEKMISTVASFLQKICVGYILLGFWLLPMLMLFMDPGDYKELPFSVMIKDWSGALLAYSILILICAFILTGTNALKNNHPFIKHVIETLSIPFFSITAACIHMEMITPMPGGSPAIIWIPSIMIYSGLIGFTFLIMNIIQSKKLFKEFINKHEI
jgi:hypothetical protein